MYPPKYNKREVGRVLRELDKPSCRLTYRQMIDEYGVYIVWAQRYMTGKATKQLVKRIKRKGAIREIKKIKRTESLRCRSVAQQYSYLVDVAAQVQNKRLRKSAWGQLVEDGAGFKLPIRGVGSIVKPDYSHETVMQKLRSLRNTKLCYEELMKQNGKTFVYVIKHYPDLVKYAQDIQRGALRRSAQRIAVNGCLNPKILSDHPGLEKVAGRLYKKSEKLPLVRQLAKDAGLKYNSNKLTSWSLGKVLKTLSSKGQSWEDFKSHFTKRNNSLYFAAVQWAGRFGKAVILIGIDYRQNPKVTKKNLVFTADNIAKIIGADSLSEDEKAAYIFNALALQYYSDDGQREVDDVRKGFKPVSQKDYFGKVTLSLEEHPKLGQRVRIHLDDKVKNNMHDVALYGDYYKSLDALLGEAIARSEDNNYLPECEAVISYLEDVVGYNKEGEMFDFISSALQARSEDGESDGDFLALLKRVEDETEAAILDEAFHTLQSETDEIKIAIALTEIREIIEPVYNGMLREK